MSAPQTLSQFTSANGGARILYWGDDMVVTARVSASRPSVTMLDTWQRLSDGSLVLRNSMDVWGFEALKAQVSNRTLMVSEPRAARVWRLSLPDFTWQAASTFLTGDTDLNYLKQDRLILALEEGNTVYRIDPSAPDGWRRTGFLGDGKILAMAPDTALIDQKGFLTVWGRSPGSEDQWVPEYEPRTLPRRASATGMALAPGMFTVFGPAGLEVHERSADGVWAKIATLPVILKKESSNVAIAGDWIAVLQSNPEQASENDIIRLFLRSATDRALWEDAGTLPGPPPGGDSRLFWRGPELLAFTSRAYLGYSATVRRFEGATVTVTDDDRRKLNVTTFAGREPLGKEGKGVCFAELPLPAEEPVPVDYRLLSGTAEAGSDFVAASGQVTIPAGSARVRVPITLLPDNTSEPREFLTVELSTAGQPVVSGKLEIVDTSVSTVLTAAATPLLEGYGGSTVSVSQAAVTGGSLSAVPLAFQFTSGGLAGSQISGLAARNEDLPTISSPVTLTAASPATTFSLSASQDSIEEMADERIQACFSGMGSQYAAGSMGWAFSAAVPPSLPAFPTDSDLGPTEWSIGGDWLFINLGSAIACYRFNPAEENISPAVQYLPRDGKSGETFMSSDERTLLRAFPPVAEEEARQALRLYERAGPADAPWRQTSEWVRSKGTSDFKPRLVNSSMIQWGRLLFERAGGDWEWRLSGALPAEILAVDGDWLLTKDGSPGQVRLLRRSEDGQPDWKLSAVFAKSADQQSDINSGALLGATLVLNDSKKRAEIRRLQPDGTWAFEQFIPESSATFIEKQLTSEATLLAEGRIFSRIGPESSPWVRTGDLPKNTNTSWSGFSLSDQGRFLGRIEYSYENSANIPRLSLLTAGAGLAIVDDDSLKFSIRNMDDTAPSGWESMGGETVANLKVVASKLPPFSMTVRVRSADNGSARAGVDYAPVDFEWPVPPSGINDTFLTSAGFPLRILSDRIPEDRETLNLLMDPVPFGYTDAVTAMTISDRYPQLLDKSFLLAEPAYSPVAQAARFFFRTAFDQDIPFSVTTAAVTGFENATPGQDFVLPGEPVILKAGESLLWVPLTLLADTLDEPLEQVRLTISAKGGQITASAIIKIVDATVPGLAGDSYTGTQGSVLTADGLNGNPPGLGANDPSSPAGTYFLNRTSYWGWESIRVQPDGSFAGTPEPNVIGPVRFEYKVESIPFQQFLKSSSTWKYLHPLDGMDPAIANPAFTGTWATAGFDDSDWDSGSGVISYGGFDVQLQPVKNLAAPPSGKRYTDYFRATFQSAGAVDAPLTLRLHCDDGAIIYVNGIERGRVVSTTSTTFAGAADTYTMVTMGSQSSTQEVALQTVNLGSVALNAGTNVLAISLHNLENTSSDLGLALVSLETELISDPVPVTITFADAHLPSTGVADSYTVPQNAEFLSSDNYSSSLLENDRLIAPSGEFYDPVLEITVSPLPAGTLSLVGNRGHFRYTPPADFTGTVGFTYQIRDKDGLSLPVPVTLNVRPTLPFDRWKAGALSANASGDADADGDGWSNFQEYALGSDPREPVTGPGYGFAAEPDGSLSLLIRQAEDLAWRLESASSPEATDWRVLQEGRGLNYRSPEVPGITFATVSTEALRMRIVPPAGRQPRLFYRLRTTRIPPQG
ncbi:MAG: Calx-beta domain-containing protein [Verrucomicrobiota bacterium]